jgi:predicted nucleic acid-binding protein
LIGIVNSSPLIYLGKIGLVDLLAKMFDRVLTVEAVRQEVLDSSAPEYAVLQEAFVDWLVVSEAPKSTLSLRLGEMGLHQGEVEVLVLAYETKKQEPDSVVVIDDLAAREVARTLELDVTGTIGILLRATAAGLLTKDQSRAKIQSLVQDTTFRMSAALYARCLSELE